MKLKTLEAQLQEVDVFDEPKIQLEQIPTSPHLAARMIYAAQVQYGDIEGKIIGDFGCGPGILSIASCMLGATSILAFDVDQDALDTAWVNINKLEMTGCIDLIKLDLQSLNLCINGDNKPFDTVIMNPPFGTRNTGIDSAFIEKAMIYSNVIYSLHKSSTRAHFIKLASIRDYSIEVVAEMKYNIPKTFKYHKEKSRDIEVDMLRFEKLNVNLHHSQAHSQTQAHSQNIVSEENFGLEGQTVFNASAAAYTGAEAGAEAGAGAEEDSQAD